MLKIKILFLLLFSLVFVSSMVYANTKTDQKISCLNAKELTMYGTSWCPHCQEQKRILGENFKKLNYIDCGENKKICKKMQIKGYPTWLIRESNTSNKLVEIPAGTLDELAKAGGCDL